MQPVHVAHRMASVPAAGLANACCRQSSSSISKLVRGMSGISQRAGSQDDVPKTAPLPASILIEGFTIPSVRHCTLT